jgi:hypothetical protein
MEIFFARISISFYFSLFFLYLLFYFVLEAISTVNFCIERSSLLVFSLEVCQTIILSAITSIAYFTGNWSDIYYVHNSNMNCHAYGNLHCICPLITYYIFSIIIFLPIVWFLIGLINSYVVIQLGRVKRYICMGLHAWPMEDKVEFLYFLFSNLFAMKKE